MILAAVVASLVVVALSAVTTYSTLNRSENFFEINYKLDNFYVHAEQMHTSAMNYAISPTDESLESYTTYLNLANSTLLEASAQADGAVAWRFQRLQNMLTSFHELFMDASPEAVDRYDNYVAFEYQGQLIQNTKSEYHTILLEDMAKKSEAIQHIWQIQSIVSLVVILAVILAGYGISMYFQKRVTAPIIQLVDNVNRIGRGKMTIQPVDGAAPELTILTNAFSTMVVAIQSNVDLLQRTAELDKRLLEEKNRNLQIQNNLVQAELRNLQAQINPHFLFNTLNLISKKAFLHGEDEICNLMEHTASLLRYSLDKANKISTLEEELDCIRNYFQIQQTRFEDRVVFQLNVDEDLPSVSMPAMALQPLVENAVIHGIRDMTEGAHVELRIHKSETSVRIFIEDNGAGMTSTDLEALMNGVFGASLLTDEDEDSSHIGIRNVYRRLNMYYGDDMQFYMESEAECGFVITLEIPLDLDCEL